MTPRRIGALILRHLFVWRRNPQELFNLAYWPLVDLLVFGFLAIYLTQEARVPVILGLLLGGLILWDIFFRVQMGITVSFLTEMWSRNLLNLFVSPLSLREFLVALMLFGVVKVAVSATLMGAVAWLLYQFNIFSLGPALVPFVVAMIVFAWAVGTAVTGILVRFGLAAETVAWSLAFVFQPFGAVFFPLSVYPAWLQPLLLWLPLPHIFEGMREALRGQPLDARRLGWAFALDAIFLVAAFAFFAWMFRLAVRRGSLLKAQD
jgi:ABC-2 type transport system permease protein